MMYENKVAAAIKVNGEVLREVGDVVHIPFGSEYSILIKNLNSVRIKTKIYIDGQDVTDGTWLIVSPNSSLDLERFIKNGNNHEGNRFKFIERTRAIENHRGIKAEDGLIRIEFKTERVEPTVEKRVIYEYHRYHYYDQPYIAPIPYWPYEPWKSSGIIHNNVTSSLGNKSSFGAIQDPTRGTIAAMNCNLHAPEEAGITVPGSVSSQQFYNASDFPTNQTNVLVFRLVGSAKGRKIQKAVVVKSKLQCVTCGKSSKAHLQFCSSCGTALSII